jgi:P pilus assembly chaperone PapD
VRFDNDSGKYVNVTYSIKYSGNGSTLASGNELVAPRSSTTATASVAANNAYTTSNLKVDVSGAKCQD